MRGIDIRRNISELCSRMRAIENSYSEPTVGSLVVDPLDTLYSNTRWTNNTQEQPTNINGSSGTVTLMPNLNNNNKRHIFVREFNSTSSNI